MASVAQQGRSPQPFKTFSARLDPETHARFKSLTAARGQKMGDVVVRFIESELEASGKDGMTASPTNRKGEIHG